MGKEIQIGVLKKYDLESQKYLNFIFSSIEKEMYYDESMDLDIPQSSVKIWNNFKLKKIKLGIKLGFYDIFVDLVSNENKYKNQYKLINVFSEKYNTTIFSNENLLRETNKQYI